MIFNDNDLRFTLVPNSFNHQIITDTAYKSGEYIPYCVTSCWMQNRDRTPDNAIQPNKLQNVPTLENIPRYKLII